MFKQWLTEDIELTFGIEEVDNLAPLEEWLAATPDVTASQLATVADTHRLALRFVPNWNEEELKLFMISRLLNAVGFNEMAYRAWAEQPLEITTQDITARGNVDFLVAAGKSRPRAPYFLLQEYMPENKTVYDARGQLVIAMLAAYRKNVEAGMAEPIYGSYVLGRFWFFVVVVDNRYAVSLAYDCTKPDEIRAILNALQQVKIYIEHRLQIPA